jgi:hypothetical protein
VTRKPHVLLIAGICFVFGFFVATATRWAGTLKDQLADAMLSAGSVYSATYQASRTTARGRSEYLVFFGTDVDAKVYMTFFEQHPDIEYHSESVYPHAVRVALKVPVRDTLEDLRAQPFTRFVVPNYPFFFCH